MTKLERVRTLCYEHKLYHFGDVVLTIEVEHNLISVSENGLLIIDGTFNEGTTEREILNEVVEIMNDDYKHQAVGTE